jgi:ABC-type nitrate/sulfonate/bicarbonate transport system substrate-binding protein
MKLRPPRAPASGAAIAAIAALALAGCGEVKNTIRPAPYSADQLKVVLAGPPDAFYVGIYEAQARGIFRQADLNVQLITPAAGEDPVTMVHDQQATVGISSEPEVLLHRNDAQPVVGVAAIVHAPLQTISIPVPRAGSSGGAGVGTTTSTTATRTTTTKTTRSRPTRTTKRAPTTTRTRTTSSTRSTTTVMPTTTTVSDPATASWPAQMQQLLATPGYPTYDGLVVVVRKNTIVNDAPLIRRFVQALARGYRAARADPARAIDDLITAVPSLAPQKALETSTLRAAIPDFFPPGEKVWGLMHASQWNLFGSWLNNHHLLSNAYAITDASTNELLPGQGV